MCESNEIGKAVISVIEGVVAGIISWKVAVPIFIELSRTEIGKWAYLGLFCFLIVVIGVEYISYRKNKLTWFMSLILGESLNRKG